jgi:hypothetical protein
MPFSGALGRFQHFPVKRYARAGIETGSESGLPSSVTMERPVLFAVARVTLRIGESSGAEPHTKGTGRMYKIRFLGLDVHAEI